MDETGSGVEGGNGRNGAATRQSVTAAQRPLLLLPIGSALALPFTIYHQIGFHIGETF